MNENNNRSFWALIVTQFFGAFNDNVLKVLISLLVVEWVADPDARSQLVSLGTAIFAAPFILFSMVAGRLADRLPKPKLIVATKVWELLVMAAAAVALWQKSIPMMLLCLFVLSMQATFFGPAKYGILPEMMEESELSLGNAWVNIGTFSAILIGTLVASHLAAQRMTAAALMGATAVLGLIASLFMRPLPAAKPQSPMVWNPLSDLVSNWALLRTDRALYLSVIAVNFFWFMGAAFQTNIFLYVKDIMKASPETTGYLIVVIAVGVGAGSYLAARLSKEKVEVGLVPVGSLGMSIFAADLFWAHASVPRTFVDFFMLGAFAGLYYIPLVSLIQWRSPAAERGRVMAMTNFLSFVAIALAALALWVFGKVFHLDSAQVFLALGVLALLETYAVCRYVPDSLLRLVLYVLTNTIYRIRVSGLNHVPVKGPALLVVNHLSLADGFLVGAALPRLVRFVMWRTYYDDPRLHWLVKTMNAIPISETDPPREILRSLMTARKALEEGHLVCIFAEGEISRTGNLLEFKRGFEVIVKGLDVPVIPVFLDRVWGSIFSFERGSVLWKKPRRIPYPVTLTFGQPIKPPVSAEDVRHAVLDLGAESFVHRMEETKSLPLEFLRRAKRHPTLMAVADSTGKKLSFGQLAAASVILARQLKKLLLQPSETPPQDVTPAEAGVQANVLDSGFRRNDDVVGTCVGIMLPPSVGGALANVAVSLLGRIAVNLNYTAGPEVLAQCIKKAEITRVLTSRKLLEKTALPAKPEMIYLEDLLATLPKWQVVLERVLLSLLPRAVLMKRWGAAANVPLSATAAILFSSGSTGIPKGVTLSHSNILSNILGLAQVFDLGKKDRILGVLPFFHSFGFTATLWFPLVHGFSAVYHTNPLDAKTVGELTHKHKATMLMATPTFLAAYIRKCAPEQFQSLRFVITGAERLREAIAKAFEEKFGKAPLEGYGCTELSPVVSANIPDVSMGEVVQVGRKPGKIGHPIPGVSVRVVDPETFQLLPQGQAGLLLVKGPNVMQGYWKDPEKTREVMRDGWYVTGDIASIDQDGFIQITDRLSRFSKIAGEMVPHVLVEEKLHAVAGRTDPTFVVTAVPDEKKGEQLVVLGAGYEGSFEDLWEKLNQSELPKLWVPAKDRFVTIESLPYLGTGKLDLAKVRFFAREHFPPPAGAKV